MQRLFSYIQGKSELHAPAAAAFHRLSSALGAGENEDSVKIEMTAPVLVAVQPGQGPFCKSNFRCVSELYTASQLRHWCSDNFTLARSINFFMEEKVRLLEMLAY